MLSPAFLLLRESPSPSCAPCLLSVLPGLKSFAANLELFNSWKKLRFFHKWLYRVEKTNTSVHCRSHKTSEERRRIKSSQVHRRADLLDMKHYKCQGTLQYRHQSVQTSCTHGTKKHNSCHISKSGVWLPWRHIIYATMKRATEDDMSIW